MCQLTNKIKNQTIRDLATLSKQKKIEFVCSLLPFHHCSFLQDLS